MYIDGGKLLNDFLEKNKCQYAIPVYQRNYEWSRDQCEKLFNDILNAYYRDRLHFCGSVVYALLKDEHNIIHYVIVDGQQRFTTLYLLMKALIDCAETEKDREAIESTVFNHDKFDKLAINQASKLKLKPIKSDNNQLLLLMDNKYDEIDKTSGIWINYQVFLELVKNALETDSNLSVRDIYNGMEKLTCAKIQLNSDDNAQEIFERINSTGVPLSLADQIRNYVLMTDADQEKLYEEFWLKIETLVQREQMSEFFLDYLNLKSDRFAKEKTAYDDFKELYKTKDYTNEGMLKELLHYAGFYHAFINGNDKYSDALNESLAGLRKLKQTTVFLFLFRVFDDWEAKIIDEPIVEKTVRLLLNYSIRRIMCEVSSNSLRGLYKSLYNRVFVLPEYKTKEKYYDAIVSFMLQMTSRDAIPHEDDFSYALVHKNLYRKNALCKYLLEHIENQGKEQLVVDNLTIEHVMPQNKNLSTAWQNMLGENWSDDRDRWLHTLGNLTLTGYNSELGDKPFDKKKEMIEEKQTKVVILYDDIKATDVWDANSIKKRAEKLSKMVLKLFPIERPEKLIDFKDPRYSEYTCADPNNATYKTPNYYVLLGERINTDSYAEMVRSVARKLYELDPRVIERMAKTGEALSGWWSSVFSYDKNGVKNGMKLQGTDIYISTGYSAYDCIAFIKGLLEKYELDLDEDFIYSARPYKTVVPDERIAHLTKLYKGWANEKATQGAFTFDESKCDDQFVRFTTDVMSGILPDAEEAKSGWETKNHYYYEIVNEKGKKVFMQFALSGKNMPDDLKRTCERINEHYPFMEPDEKWFWKQPFKTEAISVPLDMSDDEVLRILDAQFAQVMSFEKHLKDLLD